VTITNAALAGCQQPTSRGKTMFNQSHRSLLATSLESLLRTVLLALFAIGALGLVAVFVLTILS
jgi:hypothetical protein